MHSNVLFNYYYCFFLSLCVKVIVFISLSSHSGGNSSALLYLFGITLPLKAFFTSFLYFALLSLLNCFFKMSISFSSCLSVFVCFPSGSLYILVAADFCFLKDNCFGVLFYVASTESAMRIHISSSGQSLPPSPNPTQPSRLC